MVRRGRTPRFAVLLLALVLASAAVAQTDAPLPEPLTLEQALALADAPHPELEAAQARIERAHAERVQASSGLGTQAFVDITPQWVEPSINSTGLVNDSRGHFILHKRLYDFGRTQAREQAASLLIEGREREYLDARQQRRLAITARFFEVLLADLRYAVDNERMARAYVEFDRARERHAVGQVSDVDLLALEHRYQETRISRAESQARQVSARQQLAIALNRPESLPRELKAPAPAAERALPDYTQLVEQARANNPQLLSLRKEVAATQALVEAERARRRPLLAGEYDFAQYEREFATRDDHRITLNLRIPILQGGEEKAALARARANLREQEARLAQAELNLRQTVLDLVQEIETLKVRQQASKVRTAYRDLYLDRSRALYELEVRTDLGDAMIGNTEAQWLAAQADYGLRLAFARLDALTGRLIENSTGEPIR